MLALRRRILSGEFCLPELLDLPGPLCLCEIDHPNPQPVIESDHHHHSVDSHFSTGLWSVLLDHEDIG